MLTFLNLLQLVLYIPLLALLGQGLLYVLAGPRRQDNFFYKLLQLLSKPFTVVVRKMTNYPTNWNSREYLTPEEIQDHRVDQPEFLERLVFLRALPKRDYNGLKFLWREANAGNQHKFID